MNPDPAPVGFAAHVRDAVRDGVLVVQPRMGFSDADQMRDGIHAVARCNARTAATITLDSYTRVGDLAAARAAVSVGAPLNGYPILAHPEHVTRRVIRAATEHGVPVQVRHGSALPLSIFRGLTRCGIDASEGGPVSYTLPYGKVPLAGAVDEWARASEVFVAGTPGEAHLESFGGCMLGQLCPPGLLVAMSVLECLFFVEHGLRSVSLSYAQQTHPGQDLEALAALRRLAAERLGAVDWHLVLYTYMGAFPRTRRGALDLLGDAAELAVRGGAARLIVKTQAEAFRIPTVDENLAALEYAAAVAARTALTAPAPWVGTGGDGGAVYEEAAGLVDAVLDLAPDVGRALRLAFAQGVLDVPYCLHPDNRGLTRSVIDGQGRLRWSSVGMMPLHPPPEEPGPVEEIRGSPSDRLLDAVSYVGRKYDELEESFQDRAPERGRRQ